MTEDQKVRAPKRRSPEEIQGLMMEFESEAEKLPEFMLRFSKAEKVVANDHDLTLASVVNNRDEKPQLD